MRIRLKRDKLEAELKRSRLSQNAWARYLGISSSLLSMLLSGERRYPSRQTRHKLLRGLRLSHDDLFEEVSSPVVVDIPEHLRPTEEESHMSAVLLDLRQAGRSLFKSGGFALITLLLLGVGVGSAAAVVLVLDSVLLAPLPYRDPGGLVAVWPDNFVSYREVLFMDEAGKDLQQVAAVSPGWGTVLVGGQEPAQLTGSKTTPGLFRMLGREPIVGRTFAPEEFTPGRHRVALLSYGVWQRYLGGRTDVVGEVVQLDGQPHEVIGVMPADFGLFGLEEDFWTPLPRDASAWYHSSSIMLAMGRLAEGAPIERAGLELASIVDRMRLEFSLPGEYGRDAEVAPLQSVVMAGSRPMLRALGVATALVLLLVVITVGTLVLARSVARRHELSIRMALGGSRLRILRQLLLENLVLCTAGGLVALVVSVGVVQFLMALLAAMNTPRLAEVELGLNLFPITALLTAVVWLLTAAASVMSRPLGQASEAVRGLRTAVGTRRARVRGVLVTAQFALAAALVISAGLMVRSVLNLYQVDPGLKVAGLQTIQLQTSAADFQDSEAVTQFYDRLRERLMADRRVESVGMVQHLPMTNASWSTPLQEIEGQHFDADRQRSNVGWRIVDDLYFETFEVPLLQGRSFDGRDENGEPVVVINEALAREWWPDGNAVGSRLKAGNATRNEWARVIGVVANVRYTGLERDPPAALYRPHSQHVHRGMTLVVRTRNGVRIPTSELQQTVWQLNANVPVSRVLLMGEVLKQSIATRRLTMLLLVAVSLSGLVMGALGLYGLVSYLVRQRRQEIGVRLALGAQPAALVGLLMKDGLVKGVIGSAVGVAAALAAGQLLESLLFQVHPRDTATFLAVPALLLAAAAVASYLPAYHSVRADPMTSLQRE